MLWTTEVSVDLGLSFWRITYINAVARISKINNADRLLWLIGFIPHRWISLISTFNPRRCFHLRCTKIGLDLLVNYSNTHLSIAIWKFLSHLSLIVKCSFIFAIPSNVPLSCVAKANCLDCSDCSNLTSFNHFISFYQQMQTSHFLLQLIHPGALVFGIKRSIKSRMWHVLSRNIFPVSVTWLFPCGILYQLDTYISKHVIMS